MLNVHTLNGSDALRELEDLWLAKGLGGIKPLFLLIDDRRVEALLDDRPDRK